VTSTDESPGESLQSAGREGMGSAAGTVLDGAVTWDVVESPALSLLSPEQQVTTLASSAARTGAHARLLMEPGSSNGS
jgi:hypothetical protein